MSFIPLPVDKPKNLGQSENSLIPSLPSLPGFSSNAAAGPSRSGSIGGTGGANTGGFNIGSPNASSGSGQQDTLTSAFKTTGVQIALVGLAVFAGAILWKKS